MRIAVTGATGHLGAHLVEALERAGHDVARWSHRAGEEGASPVELTDPAATARALEEARPEAIVHLAAVSSYESVARDPPRGQAVNVEATRRLAEHARTAGLPLVFSSTDAVFDGSKGWYREEDPAEPVLAYGRTKLEAERIVLGLTRGLVVRLSLLYGFTRSGRPGFFDRAIEAWRAGTPQAFFADEYRTPLHLADAAAAIAGLLEAGREGLVHVGGTERLSRYDLMRRAAVALGLDEGLVAANRRSDGASSEPRPVDTSLDTNRLARWLPGLRRRSVEEALSEGR